MPASMRLRKDGSVAQRISRKSLQLFSIPEENITAVAQHLFGFPFKP